jgi:hypothetical protein
VIVTVDLKAILFFSSNLTAGVIAILLTNRFCVRQHTPDVCLKNSTILRNSVGSDGHFERQSDDPGCQTRDNNNDEIPL